MADEIRKLFVPSMIGVLFFIFGFFVTAQALDMTLRDIAVGLLAGAGAGITMLVSVLHQDRLNSLVATRLKRNSVSRQ